HSLAFQLNRRQPTTERKALAGGVNRPKPGFDVLPPQAALQPPQIRMNAALRARQLTLDADKLGTGEVRLIAVLLQPVREDQPGHVVARVEADLDEQRIEGIVHDGSFVGSFCLSCSTARAQDGFNSSYRGCVRGVRCDLVLTSRHGLSKVPPSHPAALP